MRFKNTDISRNYTHNYFIVVVTVVIFLLRSSGKTLKANFFFSAIEHWSFQLDCKLASLQLAVC